jgi:hypothetical protein
VIHVPEARLRFRSRCALPLQLRCAPLPGAPGAPRSLSQGPRLGGLRLVALLRPPADVDDGGRSPNEEEEE